MEPTGTKSLHQINIDADIYTIAYIIVGIVSRVSCVIYYVSCFLCHVSRVMCRVSFTHILTSGVHFCFVEKF